MDNLSVRIVELEPLRVASVHGFGESPELLAWQKLLTWAGSKGLLDEHGTKPTETAARIFGFNNPNPSLGSPNYGYEFWITVGPEIQSDATITVKEFAGGLYAVTRCQGVAAITATWQELVQWLVSSPYQHASHQWLEEHLHPVDAPLEEWHFDLYAPIAG